MKAVIQAGGIGTRITAITNNLYPKSMIKIGNKTILEHQINNLKRCGIIEIYIIVGHLNKIIKKYFGNGDKFDIHITYITENEDNLLGTAGSLYYLKNLNDDFIFILGDIFFDIDFKKLIAFHNNKHSDVTLLVHPNSHPFDSDLILIDNDNKVIEFNKKNQDRTNKYFANLVNSGIMVFSKKILLNFCKPRRISYEDAIIIPTIKNGTCYAYKSSEYAKDIGTPERYHQVCEDYKRNLPAIRNLSNKQKCIFLDRDGTVNEYVGFLKNSKQLKLINNVAKAIKAINNSEYLAIIITNQPVVARGETTFSELKNIHNKLETLLVKDGAYINDLYFCPHHPKKGFKNEILDLKIPCKCRKPNIGLIKKAVLDYNISLDNSFFIGDSTTDIQCAKNANIKSVLIKTGEKGLDNKYNVKAEFEFNSLLECIQNILNNRGNL